MIEIIREEDVSGTIEKRGLPKDIKQIGKPDIGDRIYVENRVYQFLHPYSSPDEKKAYVLLGRFENYAGKQCVFVEAAIPLLDMAFDGEMPLWNDHTWAYIYKQLKHEYDSMVIVGWAMDIKGQLPNMTGRLEALHQNNFGGAHQVLFLMDSLEREETFYGSRNGHLYRREGFYIYYEKNTAGQRNAKLCAAEVPEEKIEPEEVPADEGGASNDEQKEDLIRELETEWRIEKEYAEKALDKKDDFTDDRDFFKMDEKESFAGSGAFAETETLEHGFSKRNLTHRGSYRKQVEKQEERQLVPSYASTVLLVAVVCVLGVTAYLNNEKMAAMEATLAQMNQPQTTVGGQMTDTESETETPEVKVESVAGNVQKQEEASVEASADAAVQQTDQGAETADGNGETTDMTTADAGTDDADADAKGTAVGAAGQAGTEQQTAGQAGTEQQTAGQAGTEQQTAGQAGTEQQTAGQAGTAQQAGTEQQAAGQAGTAQQTDGKNGQAADADDSTDAMTDAQTYLKQGYYVVQKGDSLVGICKKIYQTTAMMDKLCEVNGIEDENSIYAGQYLTLPN